MLREPLRYAPGSRGNACARPASSRIRSCRSSDCNHHLSKSIRKVHRVHMYMYVYMYMRSVVRRPAPLFVVCDFRGPIHSSTIRRFPLRERSVESLRILSRILPQNEKKNKETRQKCVSRSGRDSSLNEDY